MPPKLTLPAGLSIAFLMSACGTNTVATVDSACKSLEPIDWSIHDTAKTKRNIVKHNKAYDAICPGQGAPSQKVAANG
jgi:hypothetical protein